MNERDRDSLEDLRDAARKVLAFTQGLSPVALASNEEKLSAVLYQFVVIGEAARRLSDECRAAHPEVPWRQIIAMRNLITHGYDQVDETKLWQVIASDLPILLTKLETILANK
jgi:uncharacterized protein with HEPN domain